MILLLAEIVVCLATKKNTLTFHTALYPVDELVGLAAVEQSSDGGQGVQDDGLRMGINVVLIFFLKKEEKTPPRYLSRVKKPRQLFELHRSEPQGPKPSPPKPTLMDTTLITDVRV